MIVFYKVSLCSPESAEIDFASDRLGVDVGRRRGTAVAFWYN